ncbi:unnamed protein product, partial [Symbiodinium sp. CCMP2592]
MLRSSRPRNRRLPPSDPSWQRPPCFGLHDHGTDGFHRDIVKQQMADSYPFLTVDGSMEKANLNAADNSITADSLSFAEARNWLHNARRALGSADTTATDVATMAEVHPALESELTNR